MKLAQSPSLSPNAAPAAKFASPYRPPGGGAPQRLYAALDLGTNNCRLLVARPTADGFRVVDAFSRIVRLGEGLTQTGRLSEAAIARTLDALRVCRDKMRARGVTRARLIATEACRSAENGPEFLAEVRERLGLQLEIVDRETEAYLAAAGCGELADEDAESTVLFDIGGRFVRNRLDGARGRRRAARRSVGIDASGSRLARRDLSAAKRSRRKSSPI